MSKSMEAEQIIYTLIKGYLNEILPGLENYSKLARIVSKSADLYTIQLLDDNDNDDKTHKEIPKVSATGGSYMPNDKVVVIFICRDAGRPYIVGKHP